MHSNVTKEQFMERRGSFSTHASRSGANYLGWEEPESMTPEEERACLQAKARQYHKILSQLDKKDPRRKELGKEFSEINRRINEIRPKMKTPGIEQYVIEVLRETMSKAQFDRVFQKAKEKRAKEESRQALAKATGGEG